MRAILENNIVMAESPHIQIKIKTFFSVFASKSVLEA